MHAYHFIMLTEVLSGRSLTCPSNLPVDEAPTVTVSCQFNFVNHGSKILFFHDYWTIPSYLHTNAGLWHNQYIDIASL